MYSCLGVQAILKHHTGAISEAQMEQTIHELASQGFLSLIHILALEQAYAPPFSSAKDPVAVAGYGAGNIPVSYTHLQSQ